MSAAQITTRQQRRMAGPAPQPAPARPPFQAGDHFTRAEFERRYAAYPEIKQAELIEGVVYMPSPVSHVLHSRPHALAMTWLGTYCASTPNTDLGDNASLRLDLENEFQPAALLRWTAPRGGRSRVGEDGYLEGAPELVVEIAASSASYDLHAKKRVYARSGVQEYLAVQMYERRIDWFVLVEGVYEPRAAGEDGLLRSQVFPGLWLDVAPFWAENLAGMLAALDAGLQTPQHEAFAAQEQA